MSGFLLRPTTDELCEAATDITAPEDAEVSIREDGKVLWVNVNGICVLRICQTDIRLDDRRGEARTDR